MASRKKAKEIAIAFRAEDSAAVVKKKVNDMLVLIDRSGMAVRAVSLLVVEITGRSVQTTPASVPRTRRVRQPRAAVSRGPVPTVSVDTDPVGTPVGRDGN